MFSLSISDFKTTKSLSAAKLDVSLPVALFNSLSVAKPIYRRSPKTTLFIKKTFKDSEKVKRIRNYILKINLYLYFFIYLNVLNSGEEMPMAGNLKMCATWSIFFFNLLYIKFGYVKFHHCRIFVTVFREGLFWHPPTSHPLFVRSFKK